MESYFFDSINHDRMYDSSHFAKFFGLFAGNGVFADPADSMMPLSDGGKVHKYWLSLSLLCENY